MDSAGENDGLLRERAHRLEKLRERFTALNLRSRTLRLNRCARSGAFDLGRLAAAGQGVLDELLARLGRESEGRLPPMWKDDPDAVLATVEAEVARRP